MSCASHYDTSAAKHCPHITCPHSGVWLVAISAVLSIGLALAANAFLTIREKQGVLEHFKENQVQLTEAAACVVQARLDGMAHRVFSPAQILENLRMLERPENMRIFLRTPDHPWRSVSDRPFQADKLHEALQSGRDWLPMDRSDALALGIKGRMASLTLREAVDHSGRLWWVALVGKTTLEKDRAYYAKWRMAMCLIPVGAAVLYLIWQTRRCQRRALALTEALIRCQQQHVQEIKEEESQSAVLV